MRRLPVIVAGTARMVLPMSDRSAAVLAGVLLSRGALGGGDSPEPLPEPPPDASPLDELASALALDPPLFFWTAHHAAAGRAKQYSGTATGDRFRPMKDCNCASPHFTAEYLATWLAENALAVLQWDDRPGESSAVSSDCCNEQEWANRVAKAVEEAAAARLLSDEGHQEQVYGDGLMRAAKRWLLREFSTADVQNQPGEEPPGEELAAVDNAARQCGLEARQRWLEPCPGTGCLPQLAKRLARLQELEKRFDETLLAEKLDSMAEFAAGAGHEINNPVAVIAGRAQLFLQGETDPERRRALALMNAQAKRIYEMIADMMLFARPPAPSCQKADLVEIIDRIISELQSTMNEQSVSLTRTGLRGPVEIEADAQQLNVALRAMCRNSFEAMGYGGRIEIDVQADERQAVIRVSDDGLGISAEIRRHIFDPFFSARQAGRGLGLGLSKCWRIVVTNHHGRIDVDSDAGRPTVFTITLPMRQGD